MLAQVGEQLGLGRGTGRGRSVQGKAEQVAGVWVFKQTHARRLAVWADQWAEPRRAREVGGLRKTLVRDGAKQGRAEWVHACAGCG
jgi:hypothetical protein